jgi:hypothetical protein
MLFPGSQVPQKPEMWTMIEDYSTLQRTTNPSTSFQELRPHPQFRLHIFINKADNYNKSSSSRSLFTAETSFEHVSVVSTSGIFSVLHMQDDVT